MQRTVGTPGGEIYLGRVREVLTEKVTLPLAQRGLRNIRGRRAVGRGH